MKANNRSRAGHARPVDGMTLQVPGSIPSASAGERDPKPLRTATERRVGRERGAVGRGDCRVRVGGRLFPALQSPDESSRRGDRAARYLRGTR